MKHHRRTGAALAALLLDLETGLRRAIDEDQLVLHYQPQLSLETGAIVGVEALVRWQHPDRGLLLPGEFIALAEQSDLILSLGEWVLRAACAQNRLWRDAGLPPVQVAVNLSARQFAAQDLPALVSRVFAQTRLGGEALDLELTESMMMLDSDAVARAIDGLRALSVSLSIDDFGTGFSSLGYLRRFAIDRLKIDRSFVSGLPEDTNGAAIATAIVSLGRSLGMTVIAEGSRPRPSATSSTRTAATRSRATCSAGRCRPVRSPSCCSAAAAWRCRQRAAPVRGRRRPWRQASRCAREGCATGSAAGGSDGAARVGRGDSASWLELGLPLRIGATLQPVVRHPRLCGRRASGWTSSGSPSRTTGRPWSALQRMLAVRSAAPQRGSRYPRAAQSASDCR